MAFFIEFTSAGTQGGPAKDVKITLNPLQIIKFWPITGGTKIFMQGLSTQEEEINVNDNYDRVKQLLGGAER